MYTIHTDVKMTRRKTMSHICDDTDTCIWSGGAVFDAFQHMIDMSEWVFRLEHEGRAIMVMVATIRE